MNTISVGQFGKFSGFNTVSHDQIAFKGELIGEAHGPGAMRSSGGDKNLQMNRLVERSELFFALRREPGFAL